MKIIGYHKKKQSQYEIELEHGTLLLHEDLILKYELLRKKEIDDSLYHQLLQENSFYLAYQDGLNLIKRKLRSRKELQEALQKRYGAEAIAFALSRLTELGYVNDRQYAQAFLHDKMHMSMDGPLKISLLLSKKGISDDIISEVLSIFDRESQTVKIQNYITKGIKNNHNKSKKALLQKLKLSLVQLGYDSSLVTSILSSYTIDDTSLREREYDKLYRKLSRKYQGKELELQIKKRMYQKGFSQE